MKKVFSILLLCLIATTSFAQEKGKRSKTRANRQQEYTMRVNEVLDSIKRVDPNVIILNVGKLNVKDKIFLTNKSALFIQQAMIGYINKDARFEIIGARANISPGEKLELASFDDNELKKVRRKALVIKVKASKPQSEKDVNGEKPSEVTYDFDATLSENRHDLYIDIIYMKDDDMLNF